eukprot:3940215-Karenia_brevis.AAC.1
MSAMKAYLDFRIFKIAAENIYDRSTWWKFVALHNLSRKGSAYFSPCRYEDDLHCVSLSYDEEAGIVHNKFLDLRVNVSMSNWSIEMWHINIQAISHLC